MYTENKIKRNFKDSQAAVFIPLEFDVNLEKNGGNMNIPLGDGSLLLEEDE
jgi:hypothetical protein